MPNWCSNELTIHGEAKLVDEVVALLEVGDEAISFDGFLPTPKELTDAVSPFRGTVEEREALSAKYGAADWYAWQLENWGVKWGPCDGELVWRHDEIVEYRFQTAWAPPAKAVGRLSRLYPELTIALAYDEPGMDFGGFAIFRNGEVVRAAEGGSRMSSWGEEASFVMDDV